VRSFCGPKIIFDFLKKKEGCRKETVAVGFFKPNAWGLCDMHGNVWEWCRDWDGPYPVAEEVAVDPMGPLNGERRITRGGAWDEFPQRSRSAMRGISDPATKNSHIGFRLTLVEAVSAHVRLQADRQCAGTGPAPLAKHPELDGFAVCASDGHYEKAATEPVRHGMRQGDRAQPPIHPLAAVRPRETSSLEPRN
jgi:hypothetical protein